MGKTSVRLFRISLLFLLFQLTLNTSAQVTINEVMVKPGPDATNSLYQSLKMCSSSTSGTEYIELYNADPCNPIDISCYIIGFNIFTSQSHGTFRFPAGSVIPPLGFLSIGGPNSGATINLFNYCSTPNLNTGNDRWYLENGDGYIILYNPTGAVVDAVYWTFSSGQASKWGTDSDISNAPTFIAAGVGCPVVASLPGPATIPIGNAEYAGQAPALGLVIHRTTDGGSTWSNAGTSSINNCNGTCNTGGSSNSINYAGNPFCTSTASGAVTLTGTSGGTYSSAAGLTINSSNGTITPNTSTPGTYTVTYTQSGCATTTSVTITAAPSATISYSGSPFCSTQTIGAVSLTGSTGGTYSSTSGLSIDSNSGSINPSTSTPGTYTVTYTIPASGGCPQFTTTASVTINAGPTASISYANNPLCASSTNETVTLTGTPGGTYSSTGGLSINPATGAINPSTSTPGTYTVTYTTTATPPCSAATATTSVTITSAPSASISYAGSPFCTTTSSGPVTLTGTPGGTYSSTAGLTLDPSTGQINPGTSTAGTYTVTYTIAPNPPCAGVTTTASVTIVAAPTATISYSGNPFCTSLTNAPVTQTGTAGGTYSAGAGLTINPATGAINPSTSTPGTYTVTYTPPVSAPCVAVPVTASVTISAGFSASISYSGSPFCATTTSGPVTLTGTGGGTFSSTSGLSINSGTGTIDPSASTPGTYTVTYTIAASGGCAAFSTTATVQIDPAPFATINYSSSPFCSSSTSESVNLTGTTGGGYSSTNGLNINSSTGEINPASSTPGSYIVTYTIPASGNCASVSVTANVTITAEPSASISYPGAPYCTNLTSGAANVSGTSGGIYSSSTGLSINAASGNVNPSLSTPGTYVITYTIPASGGCPVYTDTTTITINQVPTADAGADVMITLGSSATLTASGGGSYVWTPAGTLSCDTCAVTTATPVSTTDYCVTVTNNGCSDTACVRVSVDIICGEVFVPTAFSPNGDLQNDVVRVYGGCIEELYFAIFNRWGEKVFETTDQSQTWDGTLREKAMNNAVFFYYLSASLTTGEVIERSGNISLIK